MERLMFLVDTNIFLEGLLEQNKAFTVRKFFQNVDVDFLFITDFTLYSIGVILLRLKKHEIFISFSEDMIIGGIQILTLNKHDYMELDTISRKYKLDFDDAYQYLIAEKNNLQIISFDKHFDITEKKRKEPADIA